MPRRLVVVLAALPLSLGACEVIDGGSAHAAYLQTNLGGTVALGPSGGGGSSDLRNDFANDLGVDDSNPAALLGGSLPTTIGRFGASAFWFDSSGTGTLGHAFGDIASGTRVNTEFDFVNVKTYWVYDVVRNDTFRLAPGVALDFIDASTNVRSTAATQTFENIDVFAPVPMPFLDADVHLGPVWISGQFGGMRIRLNDGTGTYWDVETRVGFSPTENIDLFAGYRLVTMDSVGTAGDRDADVDMQVHGWLLGGGVRF